MSDTGHAANGWDLRHFMAAIHEGRVALWSWHPDEQYAVLDPLAQEMWGGLSGERHSLDDLFGRIVRDDRRAARDAWLRSAASDQPYEFDFRVENDAGETRWISARGVGGDAGKRGEEVLAVFVDVTRLREATETRDRLIREMAHRTANLFTVAQSITRLAAAEAGDAETLAGDLERRFTGLAGAYRVAVTTDGASSTAPLNGVAQQIIAPFGARDAIDIDLPGIAVSSTHLTNIAVIFHELATNAVKYGGLSTPDGRLSITGAAKDGVVEIAWREQGGETLTGRPKSVGFGSRLIDHTVTAVFGGSIEREVVDGNLHVALTLDASRLSD